MSVVAGGLTAVLGAPAAQAAGVTIHCTLSVLQYPHNSTHVGGTVNWVDTVLCDAPVTKIAISARLVDLTNGRTNSTSGIASYGSVTGQANAALPCQPGNYQGNGASTVYFPPGFSPATHSSEGAGLVKYLNCKEPGGGITAVTPDSAPLDDRPTSTIDTENGPVVVYTETFEATKTN